MVSRMQLVGNSVVPPLLIVTAFSRPPRPAFVELVSLERLHVGATKEADIDGTAIVLRRALASTAEVDNDQA